jgi:hypothetical protein
VLNLDWRRALSLNGVFASLTLLLFGLRLLHPTLLHRLLEEDGPAEWATFAAFTIAGGLYALAARRTPQAWPRLVALVLAVFSIFVAGEEISWGQRLLGFRPPEVFLEHNFQQETNVHNFLKKILDTRFVVAGLSLIYAATSIPGLARRLPSGTAPAGPIAVPLLIVAALELIYPFSLVGEAAELLFGLALLTDAGARSGLLTAGPHAAAWAWGLPVAGLAAGMLLFPLNDSITTRRALVLLPQAQRELAELEERYRHSPPWRSRLFKKRRLHKRIYTAVRARYLVGEAGYFLDAWNQPLWINFARTERGGGKVLVYSFGPNRRRDTDLERLGAAQNAAEVLEGDDLGFLLTVGTSTRTAGQTPVASPTTSR